MILRIKLYLLFAVCCLSLTACHQTVVNKEPVFDKFQPESREYKNKLAEKIQENPNEVLYYLTNYRSINNREYLEFEVEGTDFKAVGFVLVKDWRKMQHIKKNKAKGYCGAEFSLQLEVLPDPNGAILLYKDLNWFID